MSAGVLCPVDHYTRPVPETTVVSTFATVTYDALFSKAKHPRRHFSGGQRQKLKEMEHETYVYYCLL